MKLLVCLTPLVSLVVCQSTNLQQNDPYRQDGTFCYVRGTQYKAGQGYQSLDGCNTCKCNPSGDDACTRMSCAPNFENKKFPSSNQCQVNGQKYGAGERYMSPDGCNTCVCNPGGSDSCTYRSPQECENRRRNNNNNQNNNWARTPGTGGSWNSWQGGNMNSFSGSNSWMENIQNWFNNWMMSNPNWMSGFGSNYQGNSQDMMNRFRNWMMNQWMKQNQNTWNQWNNNQGNNFDAMRQMFRNRIMAEFIKFINGGNNNSNWDSNSWNWDWMNNNNRNWNSNNYRNWNDNNYRNWNDNNNGNWNRPQSWNPNQNWKQNQNPMMSSYMMGNFGRNMGNNWNGMYNNRNSNYMNDRNSYGYNNDMGRYGNNRDSYNMFGNDRMGMSGFRSNMYGDNRYGNDRMSNYRMMNENNMNQNYRFRNTYNGNSFSNNMDFRPGGYSPVNFYDNDVQKAYSFVEAHTNNIFNRNYQLRARSADRVSKQTVNGFNYRFEGLRFYGTNCPRDRSSEYMRNPYMSLGQSNCQPRNSNPETICDATVWWNRNRSPGSPEYQVTQWRCSQ